MSEFQNHMSSMTLACAVAVTTILLVTSAWMRLQSDALERERLARWGITSSIVSLLLLQLPVPISLGWLAPAIPSKPLPLEHGTREISWIAIGVSTAVGLVSLRLLVSMALLRREVRRSRPACERLLALLPASAPANLRVSLSDFVNRPMCFGWRRPQVLLPSVLAEPGHEEVVEGALRHECAHLSMGHGRSRFWMSWASIVLFWHPLYWSIVRAHRLDQELLADDRAHHEMDRGRYTAAMIDLVALLGQVGRSRGVAMGAISQDEVEFSQRMALLLSRRDRPAKALSRSRRGVMAFLNVGLLFAMVFVIGRSNHLNEQLDAAAQRKIVFGRWKISDAEELGAHLILMSEKGIDLHRVGIGDANADGQREVELELGVSPEELKRR